jgi:DNA processing protein
VTTTTVFGLDPEQVRPLVAAVTPRRTGGAGHTDADEVDADLAWSVRFASAAWSTLAEPGDGVAGALIERVGAAAALELVLEQAGGRGGDRRILPTVEALLDEAQFDGVDRSSLQAGLARWLPRLSAVAVIRSLEQAARFGIECSIPADRWWPTRLSDLGPCAPLALWTRGDAARLSAAEASAAIVGARAATAYGEAVAVELAAGLGERGVAVISGGAYGIDGAAHRTALACDSVTIAVLAGGLDRLYPVGHEAMLDRIVSTGLLVAEVPCGVPPTRWRFLQRNRVIAALAGATVVVEAGQRSGSLNTAGHAAAIGRPLGAVPGPVTSAASAGCHRLLREYGATCVTSAADALELIGIDSTAALFTMPDAAGEGAARPSAASIRVLDAVHAKVPRSTADLAGLTGMGIAEALSVLGLLENDGVIRRTRDGDWLRSGRGASPTSKRRGSLDA